jgi:hypothetical protein
LRRTATPAWPRVWRAWKPSRSTWRTAVISWRSSGLSRAKKHWRKASARARNVAQPVAGVHEDQGRVGLDEQTVGRQPPTDAWGGNAVHQEAAERTPRDAIQMEDTHNTTFAFWACTVVLQDAGTATKSARGIRRHGCGLLLACLAIRSFPCVAISSRWCSLQLVHRARALHPTLPAWASNQSSTPSGTPPPSPLRLDPRTRSHPLQVQRIQTNWARPARPLHPLQRPWTTPRTPALGRGSRRRARSSERSAARCMRRLPTKVPRRAPCMLGSWSSMTESPCRPTTPTSNTQIRLSEAWERAYWTEHLGCTEQQLRAALRAVGSSVDAVLAHLRRDLPNRQVRPRARRSLLSRLIARERESAAPTSPKMRARRARDVP